VSFQSNNIVVFVAVFAFLRAIATLITDHSGAMHHSIIIVVRVSYLKVMNCIC